MGGQRLECLRVLTGLEHRAQMDLGPPTQTAQQLERAHAPAAVERPGHDRRDEQDAQHV
jgi:hypothetical protein